MKHSFYMKKYQQRILICFSLFFHAYLAYGQTKQYLSLPDLRKANATNYRQLINTWQQKLKTLPAKEALKYAQRGASEAESCPFKGIVPHAYLLYAEILSHDSQPQTSYQQIFNAHQYAVTHELKYEIAQTALKIADLYVAHQEFSKSLPYAYKARDVFEKENAPLELAQSYYYIGQSLYQSKDYFAAEQTIHEAIYIGKDLLPIREKINAWNSIGLIHSKQSNYTQAIHIFEKALSIAQIAKDSTWMGILFGNMGNVYFEEKKYAKAHELLEIDVQYCLKGKEYISAVVALQLLGNVSIATQKLTEAQQYYEKALQIYAIGKLNNFGILVKIYDGLAKINYISKKYDIANMYYEKTKQVMDSAYTHNKEDEIIKTKNSIDFLRVIDKVETLKQKNKTQQMLIEKIKIQQNYLVLGIAFTIFMLAILINFYLKNNFKNSLLKKKNQEMYLQSKKLSEKQIELDAQQQDIAYKNGQLALINHKLIRNEEIISKQKDKLEDEVTARTEELAYKNTELIQYTQQLEQFSYVTAHNVRAPVARILGLSSILDMENFANPENIIIIEKIQNMAKELDIIIYDLNKILELEKSEKPPLETIDLDKKIIKIMKILEQEIHDNEVEINTNWAGGSSTQTVSAYIESILYNLVSNAIKYRSPDRKPVIHITTQKKDNIFIITVQDNGLGIDMTKHSAKLFNLYQRFHDHVEGKGMGLHLVKLQVESLGGTISINSMPKVGTTFTIEFKQNSIS